MTSAAFLGLKRVIHFLLAVLSIVFSVILFVQFSNHFWGRLIFGTSATIVELFKIYSLIQMKTMFVAGLKQNGKMFLVCFGFFIIYTGLTAFSIVATLGYNLNTIQGQSFYAVVRNIETESAIRDIERIDDEIDTKLRQQSELPFDYVTASDRYTKQIEELRQIRRNLETSIANAEKVQDSADTFSMLGELIRISGERVLFILLFGLSIIFEIGIAVTGDVITEKKNKTPKNNEVIEKEEQMAGFLDIPEEKVRTTVKKEKRLGGCETCLLYTMCKTPKMEVYGQGNKKILLLFDHPSATEDHSGNPFVDGTYKYIFEIFEQHGITKEDIWVSHAVQCYPGNHKSNKNKQEDSVPAEAIAGCYTRLMANINKLQPEKIFVFGGVAMRTLYHNVDSGRFSFAKYKKFPGHIISDQNLDTVVIPVQSPQYALSILEKRKKGIMKYKPDSKFARDIWRDQYLTQTDDFRLHDRTIKTQISKGIGAKFIPYKNSTVQYVTEYQDVLKLLRHLTTVKEFAFDIETTGLKPYAEGHEIDVWGFSTGDASYAFPHFTDDRFIRLMRRVMDSPAKKYGANIKFEQIWIKHFLNVDIQNWEMDTVIGAHVIDNRDGITSLKFQSFVRLGKVGYDSEIDPFITTPKNSGGNAQNRIKNVPLGKRLEYVAMDAEYTFSLAKIMMEIIFNDPVISQGYQLFHEAQLSFADMEYRGFRVDSIQLEKNIIAEEKKSYMLYSEIVKQPEIQDWPSFNPGSNSDLIELFYNRLHFPVIEYTDKGQPSTKSSVLDDFYDVHGCKIAHLISEYATTQQTLNTFLKGIQRETYQEEVHPSFSANLVSSYRTSSQNPNFTNLPERNKEAMKKIKSPLVPRPGFVFIDADYKSIESYVGAAYHNDSTFVTYLMDENTDAHADNAQDIFMCRKEDVDPELFEKLRKVGKTFSFAMQYGIASKNIATKLWNAHMDSSHKDFLKTKSINSLQEFIEHMKGMYSNYWEVKYRELNTWRNDTWETFVTKGFIESKTGFRYTGISSKNQICNLPIQGSAAHCLVFGLNEFNKERKKLNLKSGAIAEVHDAIIIETAIDEIEIVKELIRECFLNRVFAKFGWITLPLTIAGEIFESNWAESNSDLDFTLGRSDKEVA
jgi:uracil-DNA glycosylase family 4